MRKLLLVGIALVAFACPAGARSYTAELYTTDLRILDDGSLAVTEVVRFRFERGKFTHVWRTLPLRRLDGIDEIHSPDPIEVRARRRSISVRWNFPTTEDTVRTITLSYRARGAFGNAPGGRVLRWIAFPREHAYRIERARAAVTWPEAWPAPERLEVRGSPLRPMRTNTGALFEIGPLRAERTAVIEVALASGVPAFAAGAWQQRQERWDAQTPGLIAVAGVILLLGAAGTARMRRSALAPAPLSRDATPRPGPPGDLPAILAGPIRDGRVWLRHAVAGLIDLGSRGVLRFEMEPKKGRWAGKRFRIRRLHVPADLGAIERGLLESAFRKSEPDGTVEVRNAWRSLMRDMKGFERAVRAELEGRGEYDPAVVEGGRRLSRFGLMLLALGAASGLLVGLSYDRFGPAAILTVAVLVLLGATAIGIGATVPLQSASGRSHAVEWSGFARYLKEAAKGTTPIDAERFAGWLPFAMAFGIADAWLRAGKKWKIAPPPWLQGLEGERDGMAAWIAIFGASGGGHGGGSGAAGAAGGGGSGAG
jgi:hypothetical protein